MDKLVDAVLAGKRVVVVVNTDGVHDGDGVEHSNAEVARWTAFRDNPVLWWRRFKHMSTSSISRPQFCCGQWRERRGRSVNTRAGAKAGDGKGRVEPHQTDGAHRTCRFHPCEMALARLVLNFRSLSIVHLGINNAIETAIKACLRGGTDLKRGDTNAGCGDRDGRALENALQRVHFVNGRTDVLCCVNPRCPQAQRGIIRKPCNEEGEKLRKREMLRCGGRKGERGTKGGKRMSGCREEERESVKENGVVPYCKVCRNVMLPLIRLQDIDYESADQHGEGTRRPGGTAYVCLLLCRFCYHSPLTPIRFSSSQTLRLA